MRKETVISLDYREFEGLVKKTYNITNYSFVATEECRNDSDHRFEVDDKEALASDEKDTLDQVKANQHVPYSNYVIFQDLVNQGVLEPGIYIVEVSW